MKILYTLLLLLLLSLSFLSAQVPNEGFESWTNGEPNDWTTNNSDPYFTITQSNSSHSGSSALRGECIAFVPPFLPVLGPVALCYGTNDEGFPIAARFNSLKGFYKFNSQGGDQIVITVLVLVDSMGIGGGSILLDAATSYNEFGVPITYFDPATPNRCYISIQILNPVGGTLVTLGSEMYIDDVQLSMDVVSGLENEFQPLAFQLEQNYPNPFNPNTIISWQSPVGSWQSLKVYDLLGNEVVTLVNEYKSAGVYEVNFNASSLSSGIYFYKLQSGSYIASKKMILIK